MSDVRTDEHGVLRVGESRVMLDSVVAAYQQGHSAETIQRQYPALLLSYVYGAIAYCLRHRDEVDKYLQRQAALWSQSCNEWNTRSGTLAQRLRDSQRGAMAENP